MEAEREEIIFHGSDAVEAPVGVGDRLDRLGFEQTLRLELGVKLGAVLLVGREIVFRENDGLAGETMAAFLRFTAALVSSNGESGTSCDFMETSDSFSLDGT